MFEYLLVIINEHAIDHILQLHQTISPLKCIYNILFVYLFIYYDIPIIVHVFVLHAHILTMNLRAILPRHAKAHSR